MSLSGCTHKRQYRNGQRRRSEQPRGADAYRMHSQRKFGTKSTTEAEFTIAGLSLLDGCTISGNSSPAGGGLYNKFFFDNSPSGAVTLTDTIIAGNTGGDIGNSGAQRHWFV